MMARLPRAVPYTLWILFFSYTTNEVMTAGHVQEFACFTDFDKELVCHWKVPAQTNCSKEFLLSYSKEISSVSNVCIPENGKDSLRCTCTICPDYFVSGLTYILALQFNGTDIWNYNVTPALVVKPRAPKNLAIEKAENGNFNLSWEESYSPPSTLSGQPVIYELKYWRKQHPMEVSVKAINFQAKSFEITASSLRRGYDYVASLRCNYTDYPAYWSEWSEEVEFHYDYQVTAEDILQMAVPISCILIMAGSVICYFCFTKVKKEWWDEIPNPAKSHLVVKNVKFSVFCYFDEIKFPFHDLKQTPMEKQISCKNCLAQSLSSQNNIRNVEKSCSCHSKCGEWLPKGSSAVLTPDATPFEDIEICECLTDSETGSQEETDDQITIFEPCESSIDVFREHNEALANMFDALLADENNMQDNKDLDILTGERKTFKKLELENPSQRNPKESTAQSQRPCDISHTASLFTKASQDDYNCSTSSKESEVSEESFESGYRSSSINSASLDARDLQQMVHQSLFLCSSESEQDSCVLIQESTNKPFSGTKTDRIKNPANKSFDTLVSAPMRFCGSAYKSFDCLTSPSVQPCSSAYKSFDSLTSPSLEPCSSAYKSFDSLTSPSVEPCSSAYKSFDCLTSPSLEPCSSAYKSFDCLTSPSVEPCSSACKSFDCLTSPSVEPCGSAYKSFDCLTSPSVEPCSSAYKSFDCLTSPSLEPCGSAYKSFDCLTSPALEPCGSAYKSFDSLTSPSLEPCGSAYKSCDTLLSPALEPCGSAYRSFDALMSHSVANSSLTLCFDSACSSQPPRQLAEIPGRSSRGQIAQPAGSGTRYANYRSPCTELDFPNTCSECTDFPSFFTHANEGGSAFLSEEEIHKQVIYQNFPEKTNIISYPIAPQPSGYQPFDSAGKYYGPYCDNEVISLHESFIGLCNNLKEAPPDTAVCELDLRTKDCVCLTVQSPDCSTVPGLASSENDTQTSNGSPWINSSNELSSDNNDENGSREEHCLHLLELNCQDLNSRERTTQGTKQSSFSPFGKVMQESSNNKLKTDCHCHPHNHLRELGDAEGSEEMLKHVEGKGSGSAASIPASLDSIGLNLGRKTAEPLELHISDKLSPHRLVSNSSRADSHTIPSEDAGLALAIKKRPIELLRENSRKNEKKMELVQALAQEDNCYMEVA